MGLKWIHKRDGMPCTLATNMASQELLRKSAANFKSNPNPQSLSELYADFWKYYGPMMNLPPSDVAVPNCPYSEDQIREFMAMESPDIAFYLPTVLSTAREGLNLLNRGLQWKRPNFNEPIENIDGIGRAIELFGWMRIESSPQAPYTGINEKEAAEILQNKGRIGQTLNVYVSGGRLIKLLTGQSLDEESADGKNNFVRLLSSRIHGRVIRARFDRFGQVYVGVVSRPSRAFSRLGARSAELAKVDKN